MKYDKPEAHEWVQPIRSGYKLACCDCGLVHKVWFRLVRYGNGKRVQFKVERDNRATAQIRRHKLKPGGRLVLHRRRK